MVATGRGRDAVHFALYDIDADEKALLDRFEGPRYTEEVVHLDEFGEVFCYLALSDFIDEGMKPYSWYRDLVLAGAEYHAFPTDYLERLRALECLADPDRERHEENLSLLSDVVAPQCGRARIR
jgi:gamma-glutamylcyclotransferase